MWTLIAVLLIFIIGLKVTVNWREEWKVEIEARKQAELVAANWQKQWKEADKNWKEANKNWKEADKNWKEADKNWKEADKNWKEADKNWKEADKKWKEEQDKRWKEMEAHKQLLRNLAAIYIYQMGPVFKSILLKGVTSILRWHGTGCYDKTTKLSVGQLNWLNDFFDRTKATTEEEIAKRFPNPPELNDHMHPVRLPKAFSIPLQGPFTGNGQDAHDKNKIDQGFVNRLERLYTITVTARNLRCHKVTAREISQFFQVVENHEQVDPVKPTKKTYLLEDFGFYKKCFYLVFGFEPSDCEQNNGDQVLTNSGSLETVVGEDEDEDKDEEINRKEGVDV